MSKSSPAELWKQAGGGTPEFSRERYRELLREHGHLVPLRPGESQQALACGWPGAPIHFLVCDWGRAIALPHDQEPCDRPPTRPMALHGMANPLLVRLCDEHARLIEEETDPRGEAVPRG